MTPIKCLAWIIFAVIGMSATLAYTVVDFDDINYIGGKSVLLSYGWRNSTTSDGLSYCYAISGELSCGDPAGFGRAVHHLFNAVNDSYCLTRNGSISGGASNITQRVSFAVSYLPVVPNNVEQIGLAPSLISAPISTMRIYIYMNISGKMKICLRSGTSEVCPYSAATNSYTHDVQVDYVMRNDSSGNVAVYNATIWVDNTYSASLTATSTSYMQCLNTTAYYFRQGLEISNLTMINYNQTDTFILQNQSLGLGNVSYECSDGIDNDNDSFVDMLDPSCSDITDNSELPIDKVQCNDFEDNDGDNLIDLADPQCGGNLTYFDESPFDSYQCNDENDNDGDGLIDYPQDPSCLNYTDNDEFPLDGTTQESDDCSVANGCIMRESFPYSDSIYYHDWVDLSGFMLPETAVHSSDNVLRFYNYDTALRDINLYKYFTNDATLFGDITTTLTFEVERDFTYSCNATCLSQNSTFYALLESPSSGAIILKYVVRHSDLKTYLYYINSSDAENYITTYNALVNTNFQFQLRGNLTENTITIGSLTSAFYSPIVPTRVRFYANSSQFDSRVFKLYLYLIELEGQLSSGSVCTQYSPPYYLKDDFSYELLTDCGWTSAVNPLTQGKLIIENSIGNFQAYRNCFDTITNKKVSLSNRYVTLSFSFTPLLASTSERTLQLSVYGDNFKNKIFSVTFDRFSKMFGYPNGVATEIADLVTETEADIKMVIDLTDDDYDLYVDGLMVEQSIKFDDINYNFDNINGIMLSSYRAYYYFDSIQIYTSDQSGNPLLAQPSISPEIVNQTSTLFGLFLKETPKCVSDDTCESGKCMPYGTCSNFNWAACDDAGYPRTTWCGFKLLMQGFFKWVANIILDNFLMFVIFLIILMILVYFVIMFRRGG